MNRRQKLQLHPIMIENVGGQQPWPRRLRTFKDLLKCGHFPKLILRSSCEVLKIGPRTTSGWV